MIELAGGRYIFDDLSSGNATGTTSIQVEEFLAASADAVATRGDVNHDGSIDMKDVLLIRKHIARFNVALNLLFADVNRDGSVDMKDVLLIRKFIAYMIDHF